MEPSSKLEAVTGSRAAGLFDQRAVLRTTAQQARCAAGLCSGCEGLRLVLREERGRQVLYTAPCPTAQERLRAARMANAGVGSTPPTAPPQEPIDPYGLTVWVGPEPSSASLEALAHAWLSQGLQAVYVNMAQAFQRVDLSQWEKVAPTLTQPDLTILDKWDRFRPQPSRAWLIDRLCVTVIARQRCQVPTVIRLTAPLRVILADRERDILGGFIIG